MLLHEALMPEPCYKPCYTPAIYAWTVEIFGGKKSTPWTLASAVLHQNLNSEVGGSHNESLNQVCSERNGIAVFWLTYILHLTSYILHKTKRGGPYNGYLLHCPVLHDIRNGTHNEQEPKEYQVLDPVLVRRPPTAAEVDPSATGWRTTNPRAFLASEQLLGFGPAKKKNKWLTPVGLTCWSQWFNGNLSRRTRPELSFLKMS